MCVPQCKTSAKSLKINRLHKGPLLPPPACLPPPSPRPRTHTHTHTYTRMRARTRARTHTLPKVNHKRFPTEEASPKKDFHKKKIPSLGVHHTKISTKGVQQNDIQKRAHHKMTSTTQKDLGKGFTTRTRNGSYTTKTPPQSVHHNKTPRWSTLQNRFPQRTHHKKTLTMRTPQKDPRKVYTTKLFPL